MARTGNGSPAGRPAEPGSPARRVRLDDGYALQIPASPAISPDGERIVYVLRTTDRDADQDRYALWQVSAGGGDPVQLTRGTADTAPAWSPDGSRIAFLRGADGPAQIWLLPALAGEPEQLTRLPSGAGPPAWSPDGSRIAFAALTDGQPAGAEAGRRAAGPQADGTVGGERREREPVVIDRLGYKADGTGLLRTLRRHLHVADLATGEVRPVTRGDWQAGDPAWSPDGQRLAFSAALSPDADLTGARAAYVLDLGQNEPPRLAGPADGVAGPVTWTPAGDALLVAGTREVRTGHARLWRVPLDGSAVAELTAGLDRNVMPGGPGYPGGLPAVSADGETILFCARDRGCTHLFAVPAAGGPPRQVLGGNGRVVAGLSVARGAGRAAVVVADPGSFGEVAVVELASATTRVVTSHTRRALPGVELLAPAEREFTVSDGQRVHGWLLRDPAAASPAPLLLDIHGGPHNAWSPAADGMHLYHQVLAARGFAVLLLNPRGSDGYGEDFLTAAVGAWGCADERDLLEPVDQLIAEGVADPGRLAVAGYSYGGYMTCHLTTSTDRFAAAVAGGLVCDLASMSGTSDDGHLMSVLELGSTPQARRDAQRSLSPIGRVSQVCTPTLILHGAADDRCPPGQAEQWFTALREQGVPARLVLYPGASHLFILEGRPSHRADYGRRITSWVTGHLRPRPDGRARQALPGAALDQARWQGRLSELAGRHQVPGAALGILHMAADGDSEDDDTALAAHGVLNLGTGTRATPESLFQIGSITKTWTATVIMQLADEGLLDLDAPLSGLLGDLKLPGDLASRVTMRHLLTHTSGIDGDVFTDTGRGDDCLEKYVTLLADAGLTHPLGVTFSYCNSGFVLAGRVIEVLTGMTWDAALRERLLDPLGLTRTRTLPEDVLLHQAAAGHVGEAGEPLRVAPVWTLPRACGPAGLICSTPADVLAFARMHLAGGTAADGTRVLSAASVAAMQEREVDLPDAHTLGDSWGLGWIRYGWDDCRLVGHDGNTIGQSAFLRVLPSAGIAVTLLCNGGHARDLFQDLFREIFREEAGVVIPQPLGPAADIPAMDLARHTGTYERASVLTEIIEREGGLILRSTITGPLAELTQEPVHSYDLVPAGPDLFVMREPGVSTWTPVRFYRIPDGSAYLHYGGRANPKVR